jgi:hypothetical protein
MKPVNEGTCLGRLESWQPMYLKDFGDMFRFELILIRLCNELQTIPVHCKDALLESNFVIDCNYLLHRPPDAY